MSPPELKPQGINTTSLTSWLRAHEPLSPAILHCFQA
jgi:hypothetical protein